MGIDPATVCGFSLLEDGKLVEYGQIICPPTFTMPQSLNYYHHEFSRLIQRLNPDYIAIEDVILAISGVKTLVKLARINGVIVQSSFNVLADKVFVYTPAEWKANSLSELNGQSPKWKILFEVVKYFNLMQPELCNKFETQITNCENEVSALKVKWELIRDEINKLKTANVRKRDALPENLKVENKNKIKILSKQLVEAKKAHKDFEKKTSNDLLKIGNEICATTGISFDIADSICMALCAQRNIANG